MEEAGHRKRMRDSEIESTAVEVRERERPKWFPDRVHSRVELVSEGV